MTTVSRPNFEQLAPVSDRYATLPAAEAFTWDACLADVPPGEWYMVCFRSMRRADADEARLTAYDHRAHTEAMAAPGFVHYFKGPTSADGSCLSFCLWDSRAEARAASGRPAHVEAAALTFESYAQYRLEFLRVRRLAGDARFAFEAYDAVIGQVPADPVAQVTVAPAPGGFATQLAPS